jgi:hypothetical protein
MSQETTFYITNSAFVCLFDGMNKLITKYGVKEKYAMGGIKHYKVLGTLWRHKRQHIKPVAEI